MEEQGQVAQEADGEPLKSVIENAIARQEQQVQEHVATFGAEHAETLTMRSELAYSYWHAGRWTTRSRSSRTCSRSRSARWGRRRPRRCRRG